MASARIVRMSAMPLPRTTVLIRGLAVAVLLVADLAIAMSAALARKSAEDAICSYGAQFEHGDGDPRQQFGVGRKTSCCRRRRGQW